MLHSIKMVLHIEKWNSAVIEERDHLVSFPSDALIIHNHSESSLYITVWRTPRRSVFWRYASKHGWNPNMRPLFRNDYFHNVSYLSYVSSYHLPRLQYRTFSRSVSLCLSISSAWQYIYIDKNLRKRPSCQRSSEVLRWRRSAMSFPSRSREIVMERTLQFFVAVRVEALWRLFPFRHNATSLFRLDLAVRVHRWITVIEIWINNNDDYSTDGHPACRGPLEVWFRFFRDVYRHERQRCLRSRRRAVDRTRMNGRTHLGRCKMSDRCVLGKWPNDRIIERHPKIIHTGA